MFVSKAFSYNIYLKFLSKQIVINVASQYLEPKLTLTYVTFDTDLINLLPQPI